MHWVAELSNPFIIIRTVLKIKGQRGALKDINEVLFAGTFITMRLFITPVLMIALYESDHCVYTTKLCISTVLFI